MRGCSQLFTLLHMSHLGQADLGCCAFVPTSGCVCCVVKLRMSHLSLRISSSVISRFELRIGIARMQLPT